MLREHLFGTNLVSMKRTCMHACMCEGVHFHNWNGFYCCSHAEGSKLDNDQESRSDIVLPVELYQLINTNQVIVKSFNFNHSLTNKTCIVSSSTS